MTKDTTPSQRPRLTVFAPSGVELRKPALKRAKTRLQALGFDATLDASVNARHQRFAGDEAARLAAVERVLDTAPAVAMACRGGYGLTRLLDNLPWKRLARSVAQGTRWVGHSDFSAFHLGLLAHTGAISWAGPMACDDFGRDDEHGGVDEVTRDCFLEAMHGELEAVGFRTDAGFDGLGVRGTLWGGNLAMVTSLLGTPHWPAVKGGVLFLEDVSEHPYRLERLLLQLHQAGVLKSQKAILLGAFTDWKPVVTDRGYNLNAMVKYLRTQVKTPILTGLPFGHVRTKVSLPVGAAVELVVQGRDALVAWGHV